MKVYAIQPKYDEFKSYLPKDEEMAREKYASARCKGQPLDWPEALEVIADEEDVGIPEADIGLLNIGSLVLTEGAYDALKEEVEKYGQLLPLSYGSRTLWLWNVTNVLDALDKDRSEFNSFGGVSHTVFSQEQLNTDLVFKLKEDNYTTIYCTDFFKSKVERYGFSGVGFEELDVDASL